MLLGRKMIHELNDVHCCPVLHKRFPRETHRRTSVSRGTGTVLRRRNIKLSRRFNRCMRCCLKVTHGNTVYFVNMGVCAGICLMYVIGEDEMCENVLLVRFNRNRKIE